MDGAAGDHETETQGILQPGPQQIPEAGRTHRPGKTGSQNESMNEREPRLGNEPRARREPTEVGEPKRSIEPDSRSEPIQSREPSSKSEPNPSREPKASSTRRSINIPHDPTESQLHQSIAQLLDWILIEPAFYTTFPAGWGKLTKGTAGRLFASGLKKGMPDIFIFDKDQKVVGIELKVGHNSVSAAQRAMFAKLQAVGIVVYVCRSQEDVLAALYRESLPCRRINAGTNKQEPF